MKAHSLTSLAPQLPPLLRIRTPSSSARRTASRGGIFRAIGGELDGLRLERVDPGGVIARRSSRERVVGSLAYFSTDIAEPGVIRHTEGNRISLGEPDGTRSDRIARASPRR